MVTVTDSNGCTDSDTARIVIAPDPAAHLPDPSICPGGGTILDAGNPGATFDWSTGATTQTITVDNSGTYSVTVTNENGCSAFDSSVVTIDTVLAVELSDYTICAGDTAVLNAGYPGASYSWSNGASTQKVQVASPQTVSVTVTDTAGCAGSDTGRVSFFPAASGSAGANDSICPGGTGTLNAAGDTSANSYQWNNGGNGPSITVFPDSTSQYAVTITDTNGCTNIDSAAVIVKPTYETTVDTSICQGETYTFAGNVYDQPGTYFETLTASNGCDSVVITNLSIYSQPSGNAFASPDTVCPGDTSTLSASGGTDYIWSTGDSGNSVDVTPSAPTSYIVTVTNANGCSDKDTTNVSMYPAPSGQLNDVTVCQGGSVMLDAGSNGISYNWSTGDTTQTTVADTAGQYAVTVTGSNGCATVDTAKVSYGSALSVQLPDTTICSGDSVNLDAGFPGSQYNWSNGASSQTIGVADSGTYAVTVTDTSGAAGCTGSDTGNVSLLESPVADAGADRMICPGDTASLDASGGTSYLWSNGETDATIEVSPQISRTYVVTAFNSNGCSDADSVSVELTPSPQVDFQDATICQGSTYQLDAGPGQSFNWSTGEATQAILVNNAGQYAVTVTNSDGCQEADTATVAFGNNLSVTIDDQAICPGDTAVLDAGFPGNKYNWSTGENTQTIEVTSSGSYAVTVTDANSCTGVDTADVTINTPPVIDAGPDQTICQGDTAVLNATANTPIVQWNTGETTNKINVAPADTTTYFVMASDTDNGCSASDSVTVNVSPGPVVSAGPDDTVCQGDTATLTASGGGSYQWSTGDTTATTEVEAMTQSTFPVTVTDSNGCTATASAKVVLYPEPQINAGSNDTVCQGDTATLTVSGSGSYQWSTGDSAATIEVEAMTQSTYPVTVTDSNGCTAKDSAKVVLYPEPQVDAGSNDSICPGDTATLTASGGGSYQWSTGDTTATIEVQAMIQSTYHVAMTDTNGCKATDSAKVVLYPGPQVDAGGNDTICRGDTTTLTATGGSEYLWNTNDTTPSLSVSPTVTSSYQVSATDTNGCQATDSTMVVVQSLPSADAGPDTSICSNDSATLTAAGGINYQWSNGANGATINVSPSTNTIYGVTVSNANGCEDMDNAQVMVDQVPNVSISGVDSLYCENQDPDSLIASPAGGTFTGTGISGNFFVPSVAGTDQHQIVYSYTDSNNCTVHDTATAEVAGCPGIETTVANISVSAYPNPFKDGIHVLLEGIKDENMRLVLFDLTGKVINKKEVDVNDQQDLYYLDTSPKLAPGLYLLRVQSDKRTFNIRMSHIK
jgi:predicted transcriptional regulator